MAPLHVVILAAGKGKRMQSHLPKVLHRLAGRTLLDHAVAAARGLEPAAVHVVYGHGGEQVREAHENLDLLWVEQREQRGTGHAVEQALPAIPDEAIGAGPVRGRAAGQSRNACAKRLPGLRAGPWR